MNGRAIARVAAAVTSLGIGAVLALNGTAVAEPPEPTPVQKALTYLTEVAGTDKPTVAGVSALNQYTKLLDVAGLRDITTFQPFLYAAPTFGCGPNGIITTIIAAATTDSPAGGGLGVRPGTMRFSATPQHSGLPLNSGLVVAWVNLNTGASGIDALDDRTAEFNIPTLSKTVNAGPGTVLASMWGVIGYAGANCVMTPTVGTFVVPVLPAAVPEAPPSEEAPTTTVAPPPPAAGAPKNQAPAPAPAPPLIPLPEIPFPTLPMPALPAPVQQGN